MFYKKVTEENFTILSLRYYDNPQCTTIDEYHEDLKRFLYLQKLFKRYSDKNDLKVRLILNHIVILNNLFNPLTVDLLFFKTDKKYHTILATFLVFLKYLEDTQNTYQINSALLNILERETNRVL